MNTTVANALNPLENALQKLTSDFATKSYAIIDNLLPPTLVYALRGEAIIASKHVFHPAGIGRQQDFQLDQKIRTDRIQWLDGHTTATAEYLMFIENLRLTLNEMFYLGLFEFECHFAHYAPGAFYKKHRDAFKGQTNRRVSVILYLNDNWQEEDGGELMIYAEDENTPLERVTPVLGRTVVFLSEKFPHEVLTAKCDRYSLTGWFRVNSLL